MANNCVFSVYIQLDDTFSRFIDENRKEDYRQKNNNFRIYADKFIERHKKYSNSINADYIVYRNDSYENFIKKFNLNFIDNLFFKLSFLKFWIIEELVQKYDNVLYLDLDCVPMKNENFFDWHDTQTSNFIWNIKTPIINELNINSHLFKGTGPFSNRQFIKKRFNKQLQLQQSLTNYHGDHRLINTGVIGTSKKQWKDVGFFDNFENMLKNNINVALEWGEEYIDWALEGDVIMGYKKATNNYNLNTIDDMWNYAYSIGKNIKDCYITHLISKKSFDDFFENY